MSQYEDDIVGCRGIFYSQIRIPSQFITRNSYELRSPEFPRIPSASRPEYFTLVPHQFPP
jgi:hypothetical protein